ncbi:MAG: DNA topoisomerase VI subunit B [Candidatus Micrarchaeota archaeon]|nr:DNA topoisomerase VI subunit B [Candidatus Micrarchaeota archaeon]MDE1834821.1 DNA topoisomerase VI subunit B [Candidatus Micrarchaeota archaeon]MDE1859663.1 DNA topoisomerase VI subunit B [Candidatus Micrarchaeota archaeon]
MPNIVVDADTIFKELKSHSISEFFRKNSQMLGYSGKVRSLTTVVHEYSSNSLDACEEAGILPEITVQVKEIGEGKYSVLNRDNGPGIPQKIIGRVLATVLSGTKFHRYMQQRGQQGIGGSGCTMFSLITTGKPIHIRSGTGKSAYECDLSIDIKSNKPIVTNMAEIDNSFKGLEIYGEFGDVKYEMSDHGVYEYLRRTALSNPHANIKLIDPEGKEHNFVRSVLEMPVRAKPTRPHPLGVTTNDLLEFAHNSESKKIASFLTDTFTRMSANKVTELRDMVNTLDFDKDPHQLTWDEAEKLVKAFKATKWIAPDLDTLSAIGEEQIKATIKNILNPQFMAVIERKPKVFRGGIPFVVEAGIAYGGMAGKEASEGGQGGVVVRFANKVPLLFDGSVCAISLAVNGVDWKRYGIKEFEKEPVSVLVNVSSVYVPYSGVGKQAISQEPEIIEEIKLAVMDCARSLQRYMSGERNKNIQASKYNTIMRYVSQLSTNLSEITGTKREDIEVTLKDLVGRRYKKLLEAEASANEAAAAEEAGEEEEEEEPPAAEEKEEED